MHSQESPHIQYSAPAKVILFGEHAVVYGQPAIAIPFRTLKATARAERAPAGTGLTIIARGMALHVHPEEESEGRDNALTYAAQITLHRLKVPPPDLTIEIRSTIPVGGGFGSGAAVSAALIRTLAVALGKELDEDNLNALVFEVEKLHHGTPSGIDNTVVVKDEPIYFMRGQETTALRVGQTLTFIVAYSGVSVSTRETVEDVRLLLKYSPKFNVYVEQIGEIVQAARTFIEQGDLSAVGYYMNLNHTALRALTVSSYLLDTLIAAAREAGSFGAKLSGGGRGGNIIALIDPANADEVRAALKKAGAAQTWKLTLERRK